jgi:hypothetical protein
VPARVCLQTEHVSIELPGLFDFFGSGANADAMVV